MLIDSGSDWNVLSTADWEVLRQRRQMGKAVLYGIKKDPNESARAFGSITEIKAQRTFYAWVEATDADKPRSFAKFRVVDGGEKSILGRVTASKMGLLRVGLDADSLNMDDPMVGIIDAADEVISDADESEEFPSIPNFVLDFDIDPSVEPSVNAYMNIPEAYKNDAIDRLRKMERQGIIEKVTVAPRWVSGLSAVPKGNNDFRLVVNMVKPNRAIRRRFYKMPTLDEIKAKLHGSRCYTKLDIRSAFHHIKITERASDMTTFLGPDGMYRYLRLNFGVTSAPEAFQQKMEEILEGTAGVVIYMDDLLIYANDVGELRDRTEKILERLKNNNLTLNEEKCEFEKEELEFLGHRVSSEGLNIAEKKVEDFKKLRSPRNISELKSVLGIASFVSSYIRNFADITKPLWEATAEGCFEWTGEREEAFQDLKRAIVDCTVAQGYFSETDETFLYTDASPVAVGAVLVQRDARSKYRIIAFASRLLSQTEQRYAQVQREGLSVVWGAEHFWYYLVGREFTIRTDNQGITFIMKRDHTQAKRIMRRSDAFALRLGAFRYKIEFVKGGENIADPSSRMVEGVPGTDFEDGPTRGEIMVIEMKTPDDLVFPEGRVTVEEVRWHYERDTVMAEVASALESNVWPRAFGKFKSARHELREVDGLLTRMGELVIPELLRPKVLWVAHAGHPGINAMKSILRGKVWWPGMLTHAEQWVGGCKACALMSRRTRPMPMLRSNLPGAVWENIAVDFNGPYVEFKGVHILLITDLYSRFLIARPVKSVEFMSTRSVLEDVFNTFGFVRSIKSDNGAPFFGEEYKNYAKQNDINLVFSTPRDAQQNGGVETYMRLVNKGMTAPSVEGERSWSWKVSLANTIATHNAAICEATGVAPDTLMFGRSIRRNLPVIATESVKADDMTIRLHDRQLKMRKKTEVDAARSAIYSDIKVGDKVYVSRQTKKKGQTNFDPTEFTVIRKEHGTFDLLSPSGNVLSRTITFIKKVPEPSELEKIAKQQMQQRDQTTASHHRDVEPAEPQESTAGTPAVVAQPPRRSKRLKEASAELRSYIHLLGWEDEQPQFRKEPVANV